MRNELFSSVLPSMTLKWIFICEHLYYMAVQNLGYGFSEITIQLLNGPDCPQSDDFEEKVWGYDSYLHWTYTALKIITAYISLKLRNRWCIDMIVTISKKLNILCIFTYCTPVKTNCHCPSGYCNFILHHTMEKKKYI